MQHEKPRKPVTAPRIGGKIRRLRRQRSLSQAQLAQRLEVSASYLNLIEHNRRNLTVPLLLRLAEVFGLDLADLAEDDESRLIADLMEVFGDAALDGEDVRTNDVRDMVGASPAAARGVLALYDAYRAARQDVGVMNELLSDGRAAPAEGVNRLPSEQVSDMIQTNGNYFAELEDAAQAVADSAGLELGRRFTAMVEHLAAAHGVRVTVLPPSPDQPAARRFDPGARQLELSDALDSPSRNFQFAVQIGLLDASPVIDELLERNGIQSDACSEAHALGRIALANYFAAALLMPYDGFLECAQRLRYDIELLEHHFRTSFEQTCHRLTTLQRPGHAGVPFHMLRVDIAGNVSKRFTLSGIHIPRHGGACPRWNVYTAFLQPGTINAQVSRMPDGATYFCIARTVQKAGGGWGAPQSTLSIGLGCEARYAHALVYADGMALDNDDAAVPIGVSCRICPRMDCRQRAFAPVDHRLRMDENVRGLSAYVTAV